MKHIKKTSSPPMLAALLAGAALLMGLVSQSALAVGTASATVIANMASVTYDVGGSPLYICSAPGAGNSTLDSDGVCVDTVNGAGITSFAVDNKVDLLVTEGNTTYTTASAGSTTAVTTFTVKNEGNTTQDFLLATAQMANGTTLFTKTDDFDATSCAIALSSTTGAATFSATGGSHLDALVADEIATVTVTCTIPAATPNGAFAVTSLTATARANDGAATLGAALAETANTTAGTEIVFGDAAKAATGDTIGDGIDSDRDAYFVQSASLTITKTVATLCDPVDGATTPHNIPGAVVRWTITIANTGTVSANLTSISDAVPTNTALDPDLITGAGVGTACEYGAGGSGTPENAVTRSVRIQNTNARSMAGTAALAAATSSYFVADAADANGDGVTGTGTVSINFATALPALLTYAAGELKAGETLTIYFNVGIN